MTPASQIHSAATIISEGAYMLEDTIDRGGFAHPGSFVAGDLERTEKRLRDMADKIRAMRLQLVAATPDMPVQVVHLQAAE
jgi:hypothetical protein